MAAIKLYNTLARKKQAFQPLKGKTVGLYTCGPTVYSYAHIGNLRTFIFYDVLRRALTYVGYRVRHVMNITDVGHLTSDADSGDDKLAAAAARERKSAWQVADFYTNAFLRDAGALNILPPTALPKATEHIAEQIDLVAALEKKGLTYTTSDGVYFDTAKFPDYGRLSRQSLKEKQGGKRVAVGEKHQASDFALWKFSPSNARRDMEWPSPWGTGFPGWHLECSAMSKKYLGQPFDIHAGGVDHLAVHHENEIAQSVAAYGKPLARYWLHAEFLVLGKPGREVRMGKSLQNFTTLQQLQESGIDPLALRYLFLSAHYRTKLYYSQASIEGAAHALARLQALVVAMPKPASRGVSVFEREFAAALADDINMPKALAVAWRTVRSRKYPAASLHRTLLNFDSVLGLGLTTLKQSAVPAAVEQLQKDREAARQAKDWARADELRDAIQRAGYVVEDTAEGPRLRRAV